MKIKVPSAGKAAATSKSGRILGKKIQTRASLSLGINRIVVTDGKINAKSSSKGRPPKN